LKLSACPAPAGLLFSTLLLYQAPPTALKTTSGWNRFILWDWYKEGNAMKLPQPIIPALTLVLMATPLLAHAGVSWESPLAYGQGYPQGGWDTPPQEFRDIQRQGYHDGIEGARKDFQNHRRPDVNNRDEYRHPHVAKQDRNDYREGFERGYQVGVAHIYGTDHDHGYDPH
jgi:ribosome modulation factor